MTGTTDERIARDGANAQGRAVGRCPVIHTDYRVERPAFETWQLLNEDREEAPAAWNDSTSAGFWVVNRYDDVREALGMHEVFTNDVTSAFITEQAAPLLPQNLNQPEHADLRRVLNPYFSPAAVKRLSGFARERARELVDQLEGAKRIDITEGFAMQYPTDLFLALMGLPVEDGEWLLPLVEDMFLGFFNDDDESVRKAVAATTAIDEYFEKAVDDRVTNPRDPAEDLISRLLVSKIRDQEISRRDIVVICTTLMAAGLDTTRSALGYVFHHLAGDEELRHHLTAHPEDWPRAIEESIRLYSLLIQDGRKVGEDITWRGMEMKKGDMVWLGLAAANRDPRKFPDPDRFDMDRENLSHHMGFGIGHHRCIGMHLARAEMVIALEEWHARIPDYRIAPGQELRERGGQLRLQSLVLEWD
ncbi:cytochrome P450 [Nocardioides sp. J9]|uniref:cytochrome P450 n=1 Tax=Nocardioides sp. J9 TaxID=935844 RepID=UPI0011A94611|nr:cytochrome P450 [Nocardioides sp. J9]TWG96339.1 cytochrome P450 [Nocardioides sp. J9]